MIGSYNLAVLGLGTDLLGLRAENVQRRHTLASGTCHSRKAVSKREEGEEMCGRSVWRRLKRELRVMHLRRGTNPNSTKQTTSADEVPLGRFCPDRCGTAVRFDLFVSSLAKLMSH